MKQPTAEMDAAALLRALQPKLAAVGITRLADVTGLDRVGLPVVLAVRPLGRSLAVSQGKGLTRDLGGTATTADVGRSIADLI